MSVVVVQFGPENLEGVRRALDRGNTKAVIYGDVRQARDELAERHAESPNCLFIDGSAPDIGTFVGWLRGEAKFFSVPVVVVVPALDEAAYAAADALGADDVIPANDPDAVSRRVSKLATFDPMMRPPITEGRAIVAHAELGRRRIFGRALRQAGFDVMFAAEATELIEVATTAERPRLCVIAENLPPEGAVTSISVLRSAIHAPQLPIVVVAPSHGSRFHESAASLPAVAISSELAPAHNLLFLANNLLRSDLQNYRVAPRLLYGALCSFRQAGELVALHGLTYNISRTGLYIRTLDPPPSGSNVWLELRPPRETAAIHIRGRVMWTKGYGAQGAAPPGFGVHLEPDACPPADLQKYHEAYERFRVATG